MRICVTGLRGVPGVMGGVEAHCEQLYPRIKELRPNFEITILGRRTYIESTPDEYRGLTVVALPSIRTRSLEAISNTFLAVWYARFARRADIVHIHGIGPALMAPLARMLGMKVICTYHSKNFEHQKWGLLAKAMLRLGEYFAIRSSNRLIVVSRSLTAELKKRYPTFKDRIEYIPNGAPDFSSMSDRRKDAEILGALDLTTRSYILAVGRLVPEKAFHDLLSAFKSATPLAKLVIAGKADHADTYSRDLLRQASDRIRFVGFQNQPALCALYRNASLFVLPSVNEGLPISALEAISLDAPVLLSDIQPNLDLDLPPTNYFRSGDVADLSHKLLEDPDSFRVDAAAVLPNFDWTEIARATERVYQGTS